MLQYVLYTKNTLIMCLVKNFTSRGIVYVGNITGTVFFLKINYGLEDFGNGP